MRCRIINNTLNNSNICVCVSHIATEFFFNIISGEAAIVQYPMEKIEKNFSDKPDIMTLALSVPLSPSHHPFLSMIHTSPEPFKLPVGRRFHDKWGRRSRGLNSGNKFANKFLRKFATSRESSSENFGASSVAISSRYSLRQNLFYLKKE